MKKTMTLSLSLALTFCLLPVAAFAQGHMMNNGTGQGGYGHGMMYNQQLDKEQYEEWQAVYEKYRQPMNQLSWKLRRTSAELGEMLAADKLDDKAVVNKAEEIGKLQAERYVMSIKMRLELQHKGLNDWVDGMGMMHGGMGMMGTGMMHGSGMGYGGVGTGGMGMMRGQGMIYGPGNRGWDPDGDGY